MNAITLHIKDKSNALNGIHAEQGGKQVSIEGALTNGFRISEDDAPLVLSLIEQWVRNREQAAM
jgi:hypothetical protein